MSAIRLLLWLLGLGPWVWPARGENPLLHVEQYVATRFADLQHIAPEALAARHPATVVFDVRSAAEFDAGHIAGAIHLAPDTGADDFQRNHGRLIAGRDLVFYCAVGLRSARLARRLRRPLEQCGAVSVSNLRGGIFGWHRQGHGLHHRDGGAGRLHPYDAHWARFTVRH